MRAPVRLIPHREGPWLLYVGRRCFAIEPSLGRRWQEKATDPAAGDSALAPQIDLHELTALLEQAPAYARAASGRRAVWPRLTLLPAWVIIRAAHALAGLTRWPLLGAMVLVGLAAYVAGWAWWPVEQTPTVAAPASFGAGLLLLLAAALWHELGHAAALRREGYPPGRVGVGWLLFFPVLFCDVTPVAVLDRGGRLRVDCAGMAFQVAAGGLLFWAGSLAPADGQAEFLPAAARLAGLSSAVAVCWSLLPFLHSDGYWLLCDLLGVPSLEAPLTAGSTSGAACNPHRLAVVLIGYRLANVLFLLLISTWLPRRLLRLAPLADWWAGDITERALALGLGVALVAGCAWIWWSAVRRMLALLAACTADAQLLQRRRQ